MSLNIYGTNLAKWAWISLLLIQIAAQDFKGKYKNGHHWIYYFLFYIKRTSLLKWFMHLKVKVNKFKIPILNNPGLIILPICWVMICAHNFKSCSHYCIIKNVLIIPFFIGSPMQNVLKVLIYIYFYINFLWNVSCFAKF